MDLILSSGYLAFARHAGVLAAVEEARLDIDGLCGTSSGALAAALWAAGLSAERVAAELSALPPMGYVKPHWRLWRGMFLLDPMVEHLRGLVPPRVEDLERPFAAGVVADGQHRLIDSGPLPEVVAASCAVPYLFAPVTLDGTPCRDGGALDRTGLDAWRRRRPGAELLLHLVERSGPGADPEGLDDVLVVRTPRSGGSLWSLGDFEGQRREALSLARGALASRLTGTSEG